MMYRLFADAVVGVHLAFIVFVIAGGFLIARLPALAWLHLPAVAWVAWLEFTGAICPLTPLENLLRVRAGDAGYAGGFVERYLLPVIYPAELTAGMQVVLGALVVGMNIAIYGWLWRRRRRRRAGPDTTGA